MLIELLTKRYPGMRAWLSQRLTACVMAVYSLIALVRTGVERPDDYASWLTFNQPIWWRVASILFWCALSIHAWLGICDVFKDYVPNTRIRNRLVQCLRVVLWIYLIWIVDLFLFQLADIS